MDYRSYGRGKGKLDGRQAELICECGATRTHSKFIVCVVMISRATSQKIMVQKRSKYTEIELDKSIFRSYLGSFVFSQEIRRFCMREIIKTPVEQLIAYAI